MRRLPHAGAATCAVCPDPFSGGRAGIGDNAGFPELERRVQQVGMPLRRVWPDGTNRSGGSLNVREVLVISNDDDLTRWLCQCMEELGLAAQRSRSLENSFLEAHGSPFMVVVDATVVPEEAWQAKEYLAWFHRRCPVLLLTAGVNAQTQCQSLGEECDLCLPQEIGREQLVNSLQQLGNL